MANGTDMRFEPGYGERIRRAIKQSDVKLKDIAEAVGVQRAAIYKWIHEETKPGDENMDALARVLRVSVDELALGKKKAPLGEADRELVMAALEALEEFAQARGIRLTNETRRRFVDIVLDSSVERGSLNRDVARNLIDALAAAM